MPILTPPTPSNLLELAGTLSAITNNTSIYLYKDANGFINGKAMENYIMTSINYGYPYSFINGETVYTMLPITTYTNIPFTNMISTLSTLYTSKLSIWIDGKDNRTISNDLQKIISKSYENQIVLIENTSGQSFTYSGNNTIDLTTGSNIEAQSNITITQYFKIALIITFPTQNINNKTIFQHNNFSLRITQQTSPEGTLTYMIGIFDNGTFKRGITFKPSDLTYKYFVYTDDTGKLVVNGNTSVMTGNPSYYQATTQKIYVGQDSSGLNNSLIKLHEILYYQSTSNDIATTDTDLFNFLNTKWTLSTYSDSYNVNPFNIVWDTAFTAINYTGITITTNNIQWTTNTALTWDKPIGNTKGIDISLPVKIFYAIEIIGDVLSDNNHEIGWVRDSLKTTVNSINDFHYNNDRGGVYPAIGFFFNGTNHYCGNHSGGFLTVSGSGTWNGAVGKIVVMGIDTTQPTKYWKIYLLNADGTTIEYTSNDYTIESNYLTGNTTYSPFQFTNASGKGFKYRNDIVLSGWTNSY